ncbi:hypothetical protein FGO68_gene12495 [Halteria grandinella]|uniref:Uncharacterized protein n=1 Tax=Halteria grandinella TaxID=5974 RepID=A0A8J8TAB4_HALGN|nr:hypothetical protein FGO68_gene12495 [Halteria grandinella]
MRAEKVQNQLSNRRQSKLQVFSGTQGMLYEENKEGSLYGDELTSIIKNQSLKTNSPKASNKTYFSSKAAALFKIQPVIQESEATNGQADETLHDLKKSSAVYTKKNSLQTPLQKKYSNLEHSEQPSLDEAPAEKEDDVVVLQAPQRKKGRKTVDARQIQHKVNSLKIQPQFYVINEQQEGEDNKKQSKRIGQKRELIRNIVEGKDQEIITRLEEPIKKAQKLEISLMEKSLNVSGFEDSEQ